MIKEFKKNIPEYVKTGIQGARSTLLNIEKDLKEGYEKVSNQALNRQDLKKRLNDFQKKAADSFEKAVNTNIGKAFSMLNLPTKTEVEAISKKVNKINQDIRKMVDVREKGNHGARRPKIAAKRTSTTKRAAHRTGRA
jgi:hypothetical protein